MWGHETFRERDRWDWVKTIISHLCLHTNGLQPQKNQTFLGFVPGPWWFCLLLSFWVLTNIPSVIPLVPGWPDYHYFVGRFLRHWNTKETLSGGLAGLVATGRICVWWQTETVHSGKQTKQKGSICTLHMRPWCWGPLWHDNGARHPQICFCCQF